MNDKIRKVHIDMDTEDPPHYMRQSLKELGLEMVNDPYSDSFHKAVAEIEAIVVGEPHDVESLMGEMTALAMMMYASLTKPEHKDMAVNIMARGRAAVLSHSAAMACIGTAARRLGAPAIPFFVAGIPVDTESGQKMADGVREAMGDSAGVQVHTSKGDLH